MWVFFFCLVRVVNDIVYVDIYFADLLRSLTHDSLDRSSTRMGDACMKQGVHHHHPLIKLSVGDSNIEFLTFNPIRGY